ncbi:MAG: hypothetical protein VX509_01565 [Verrucomicrobiota bacterium]|nr:hypothetical protein [Verrucomicrobiota bacterium]
MKGLIPSFVCLGLAVCCLSLPALGQAQDDTPATAPAAPDLGPVIERLDQVVAGLAKISGSLAKLQKASGGNAKEKSLKTATKQLSDLNAAVESLAGQLAAQAKAAGHQADDDDTANLLERLVALQQAAADRAKRPAPRAQWEYKSIFGDSRVALEEEMNQFGQDGWEFFNITSFGRGSAAFARRPIDH